MFFAKKKLKKGKKARNWNNFFNVFFLVCTQMLVEQRSARLSSIPEYRKSTKNNLKSKIANLTCEIIPCFAISYFKLMPCVSNNLRLNR